MDEDFKNWLELKNELHNAEKIPQFSTREIWWGCIGHNVGHESNGKNELFNRPVLVVRKFNYRLCWGVPLTSQTKDNPHYHHFYFEGQNQCAMLTQMRLFDTSRFTHRLGKLPQKEFQKIKRKLIAYLE